MKQKNGLKKHKCRECGHYPSSTVKESYCAVMNNIVTGGSTACVYGIARKPAPAVEPS